MSAFVASSVSRRIFLLVFLAGLVWVLTFAADPTRAATITVNVSYDSVAVPDSTPAQNPNDCSLREAIQNANDDAATYNDCPAGSGADIITFSGVSTITFDGQISVVTDIQIAGPVTFSGNDATNMFVVAPSDVAVLRLDQVTLRDGFSTSGGAIVQNGGTLVCTESRFEDNVATEVGGAIAGNGTLNVNACFFERNTAQGNGGAISHTGVASITIDGTVFRQNQAGTGSNGGSGGAIHTTSPMTVTGSAFDRNSADVKDQTGVGGGAIYNFADTVNGTVITASVFSGNEVNGDDGRGGAIYNNGVPLTINYSHFGTTPIPLPAPFNTLTQPNSANGATSEGGAVYLAATGPVLIVGTSFLGNSSARHGGALAYSGTSDDVTVVNSTFSDNFAEVNGGAVYVALSDSALTLTNVTIAGNSALNGGGVYNNGDGDNFDIISDEIVLQNTIVYNNSAPTNPNCGGGTVSSDGPANNIPSGQCANAPGVNGSPNLGSPELTFSIGSIVTYVLPLGANSAALGTGSPTICAAFPVLNLDQRIFPRPQGDVNCDVGAYESGNLGATPTPSATATFTATNTPTETATPTETSTPTPTPTATATATSTLTPTPTTTGTGTLTPTLTATETSTLTPTPTTTGTGTLTPTLTATETSTLTPTPTTTGTGTLTPTLTATETSTLTPTPTTTGTGTLTPTLTTTATETSTLTPTLTTTATSTLTPTPTGTETSTPTPTTTATGTSSTATPTFTPTLTVTGTQIATLTPSITPMAVPTLGSPQPKVEVFLCDNLANQSEGAMIAFGGVGNVRAGTIIGSVYCRIIVRDAQVITRLAEIGVQSVIDAGVLQAVDMFGLLPDGTPVVPFINPMTICLRGTGTAMFLSAANSLRTPMQIPISPSSPAGYSCGSIPVSGTVVLVGGSLSAPAMTAPNPASQSMALSNCQVRTTNPVNFRSAPDTTNPNNVLAVLSFQTVLTASERIPGWFGVLYDGAFGWVAEQFVETIGTCG